MAKTPPIYDEPAEAPESPEPGNDLFGQEPEDDGPVRAQDAELKTIALILRTLGRVDPKARGRIMTYLVDRFCEAE